MIVLESVSRTFDNGRVVAVDNVSVEIAEGERLALKGPSGAGKSTLLNLIGALERPSSGQIFAAGMRLSEINRLHCYRAGSIGFVFQFHHLLPHLTALENVEIPLVGSKLSRRERRRRAMELLDSTGIGEQFDRLPERMSGGERQRVAVARALVNQPCILLADEPTGSLDADSSARILELLIEYCEHNQATLIVATHNDEVAGMMNRILYMDFGRIVTRQRN